MANMWYLSRPLTNSSAYKRQWLQEIIYNGKRLGYVHSWDDGQTQHHYCIDEDANIVTIDGSVYDYFTGESIWIE